LGLGIKGLLEERCLAVQERDRFKDNLDTAIEMKEKTTNIKRNLRQAELDLQAINKKIDYYKSIGQNDPNFIPDWKIEPLKYPIQPISDKVTQKGFNVVKDPFDPLYKPLPPFTRNSENSGLVPRSKNLYIFPFVTYEFKVKILTVISCLLRNFFGYLLGPILTIALFLVYPNLEFLEPLLKCLNEYFLNFLNILFLILWFYIKFILGIRRAEKSKEFYDKLFIYISDKNFRISYFWLNSYTIKFSIL